MPNDRTFPLEVMTAADSAGHTVMAITPEVPGDPVMTGGGDFTFTCGSCQRVLLKDIGQFSVQNMVFVCPDCGAYNFKI